MKLSTTKYVQGFRELLELPSNVNKLDNQGGLRVGEAFAFLIFLQAKTGEIEKFYNLAQDAIVTASEEEQLNAIRIELDRYGERLMQYEEYLLGHMEHGLDAPELALPVERPLFYGYFGKTARMPGGSPLCGGPDAGLPGDCDTKLPDISTPVMILNSIDEIMSISVDDWETYFEDTARAAAEMAVSINVPALAIVDHDTVKDIGQWGANKAVEVASDKPRPRGPEDGPFKHWKWAAYGLGAGVGTVALYRLLK